MVEDTLTKDQILGALPKLSQSDIAVINAVSGQLIKGTGAVTPETGSLAGALLNALCVAVNAAVAPSTLAGTATGKTFNKHLPAVGKFLDAHFRGYDANKLIELAFLRLLADLLRDDLKNRGVTPTIGILVTNLTRLPEVFDNAYPGYLEAGMGTFVLQHLASGRVPEKTQVGRKKPRRI